MRWVDIYEEYKRVIHDYLVSSIYTGGQVA